MKKINGTENLADCIRFTLAFFTDGSGKYEVVAETLKNEDIGDWIFPDERAKFYEEYPDVDIAGLITYGSEIYAK